jgi:hypothetical protein
MALVGIVAAGAPIMNLRAGSEHSAKDTVIAPCEHANRYCTLGQFVVRSDGLTKIPPVRDRSVASSYGLKPLGLGSSTKPRLKFWDIVLDLIPSRLRPEEDMIIRGLVGLDLSRFSVAPGARFSHLSFEGDRAFSTQC